MIDWQAIIHAIDAELGTRTATAALLAGFACSIGLTQLAKFSPQLIGLPDANYRVMVRLFAFLAGAIPTWILWPLGGATAAVMAVTMGLIAPGLYTVAVRVLTHFFPWLDGALSGRPDPKPPAGNDFHQLP